MDIPRNRWGQPLIIPAGGGKPVPYVRASTMAKTLDDTSNLMLWKQRVTAVGLAKSPDLRARLAGLIANHPDPIGGDGKRDLSKLVEEAAEAGGASDAASMGTGWHALTEALDAGTPVSELLVDDATQGRLVEYVDATAGLDVLGVETFVVNDTVQAAGTFDRLVRLPDGRVVVADLKTGTHDANYPLGVTTQIAVYAHGHRYDPATGERTPLHEDLDVSAGLLIHLPQKGEGCRLYLLDLAKGWEAALTARAVYDARKWKAPELRAAYEGVLA